MTERRRRSLSSDRKIGKYELRESIRTQPDRALFSAYDPFLDRVVAIKIVQLFSPGSDQEENSADTFFSEARAIASLQHQNIVSVYDAGMGDYEGYMVMEFIHGESLLQRLNKQPRLPVDEVLHIGIQICQALHYAHAKNVVHRDIKPSNIMLADDGQVKLVDFGISFVRSEKDANVPGLVGTPCYMAPELVHASSPTERSDLFSLGVVLYEMISGRLPFSGKDAHGVLYKIINNEPLMLEKDIPIPVSECIYRLLAKNPQRRFNSAQQLENTLRSLVGISSPQILAEFNDVVVDADLMKVFNHCTPEILIELEKCIFISSYSSGDVIHVADEITEDEYFYPMGGRIVARVGEKELITNAGQWLVRSSLEPGAGEYSCEALDNSRILHVSGEKLQTISPSAQAYFYRNLASHFILRQ